MRLIATEHSDGVCAVQAQHGLLHGGEQIAVIEMIDQMRDDLGVGLALEHVAAHFEFVAQRVVVFDDAVMDERDAVA